MIGPWDMMRGRQDEPPPKKVYCYGYYPAKERVKVDGYCFSCEHGGPCPAVQRQAPVKASCRIAIHGEFSAPPNVWGNMARVYFNDAVPLCSVCRELWDWDPEFTNWLRLQYTDFRAKGAE